MEIAEAQDRIDRFLSGQMRDALRTVDHTPPRFDTELSEIDIADAACAEVEIRHLRRASDATYLIRAFGDALLMQVQLNVFRFVIVYRIPATGSIDAHALEPRFERWQIGAGHAGWTIGWRDAINLADRKQSFVEVYCYAMLRENFIDDPLQQLYWRTDIVQMTRYFMLEAHRCGLRLSPAEAEFTF